MSKKRENEFENEIKKINEELKMTKEEIASAEKQEKVIANEEENKMVEEIPMEENAENIVEEDMKNIEFIDTDYDDMSVKTYDIDKDNDNENVIIGKAIDDDNNFTDIEKLETKNLDKEVFVKGKVSGIAIEDFDKEKGIDIILWDGKEQTAKDLVRTKFIVTLEKYEKEILPKLFDKKENEETGEITYEVKQGVQLKVNGFYVSSKEDNENIIIARNIEIIDGIIGIIPIDDGIGSVILKDKLNTLRKRILGITLGALLLLILFLLTQCQREKTPVQKPFEWDYEEGQEEGGFEETDRAKIIEELNKKVAENMFEISMNTTPTFENINSKGLLNIINVENNRYLMQVILILEDSGKQIYKSGAIKPGSKLVWDTLDDKTLTPGKYQCVARFIAIDEESKEMVGEARAKIKLSILG